jgi:2-polyprenyl-3-methyl-5-hydroxy-6-metoxy-1,4-benzoquinol methylase
MRAGDKTFYDGYWKDQRALTCDEKCRLRFIVSEVDNVIRRQARAAINLGTKLGTAGPKPRLRIADVGCGRGWLTEVLSHFGEAVGFDQSTVEAARRYPRLRFVECDVLDLGRTLASSDSKGRGGPNSRDAHARPGPRGLDGGGRQTSDELELAAGFDLAVCSEVIEHVRREDQHRLVESISSILRQDGTLILTTPNRPVVTEVVEALTLQNQLQPVEEWLDAEALTQLLCPHFEVQELTTVMFFPARVRKVGPLSRAYRTFYESWGAHRAIDPVLGPTLRGLYLGVMARKRPASTAPGAPSTDGTAAGGIAQ